MQKTKLVPLASFLLQTISGEFENMGYFVTITYMIKKTTKVMYIQSKPVNNNPFNCFINLFAWLC